MTTIDLTDTQLAMLKECLIATMQTSPGLYPTAELLLSHILEAEQKSHA